MWEIELHFVRSWMLELEADDYDQVVAALELLEEHGPHLGRPLVDSIAASRHNNMKEVRPGSRGRSEIRILFAFDPTRRAILLTAGDKAGQWRTWYRTNVPLADKRYDDHLAAIEDERKGIR